MLYLAFRDGTAIHDVLWRRLTIRYALWLVEEGSDVHGGCEASMPHLPRWMHSVASQSPTSSSISSIWIRLGLPLVSFYP